MDQIEYFLVAADYLSMSEAAKHLFMTQPTLSRKIITMETELGIQLFHRGKKGLQLTDAGNLLKNQFQEIIAQYKAAVEQAKAVVEDQPNLLNETSENCV